MHLKKRKKEKKMKNQIKMKGKPVCFIHIYSNSVLCFGAAAM